MLGGEKRVEGVARGLVPRLPGRQRLLLLLRGRDGCLGLLAALLVEGGPLLMMLLWVCVWWKSNAVNFNRVEDRLHATKW